MLSIRMRASKKGRSKKDEGRKRNRESETGIHISGAEGIYREAEKTRVIEKYLARALSHPRGKPDKIVITVEKIGQKPKLISALPVKTLQCRSVREAEQCVEKILRDIGISEKAFVQARRVLNRDEAMRGASIICAGSGRRLEPDKKRGVRASRLGISPRAEKALSSGLSSRGINTETVREALLLASKIASHNLVEAELCMSDDPDYTTGYVSSKKYGYVRIPNIKRKGDRRGGRVIFIKKKADMAPFISFLEKIPVIINRAAGCAGICSIDEILYNHNI